MGALYSTLYSASDKPVDKINESGVVDNKPEEKEEKEEDMVYVDNPKDKPKDKPIEKTSVKIDTEKIDNAPNKKSDDKPTATNYMASSYNDRYYYERHERYGRRSSHDDNHDDSYDNYDNDDYEDNSLEAMDKATADYEDSRW